MKLPANEATSTRGVPPFVTDEKAVNDYYPFGMTIAERSYSTAGYRYGFGGHELDNEVKGTANHLDFGSYGYDPRVGRRWNIEPNIARFASKSSYLTLNDNPILYNDPDGKVWKLTSTDVINIENFKMIIKVAFDQKVNFGVINGVASISKLPDAELNSSQTKLYKLIEKVINIQRVVSHDLYAQEKSIQIGMYQYIPLEINENEELKNKFMKDQDKNGGLLDIADLKLLQSKLPQEVFCGILGHEIKEQMGKFDYIKYNEFVRNSDFMRNHPGYPIDFNLTHISGIDAEKEISGWKRIADNSEIWNEDKNATMKIVYEVSGKVKTIEIDRMDGAMIDARVAEGNTIEKK